GWKNVLVPAAEQPELPLGVLIYPGGQALEEEPLAGGPGDGIEDGRNVGAGGDTDGSVQGERRGGGGVQQAERVGAGAQVSVAGNRERVGAGLQRVDQDVRNPLTHEIRPKPKI